MMYKFSKRKVVVAALLLLGLTALNPTLASDQNADDYGRELVALTVLSTGDEESSSDDAPSVDEHQAANQIAPRNHAHLRFLAKWALIIFYVDTTFIELMYFILSLRYLDPLVICHSMVLFATFVRGITSVRNPTNAALIQLLILTCLGTVLGCLAKDKIFMIIMDISGTGKKIETKA